MSNKQKRILIVGGGTAGITVAASLARRGICDKVFIAIVEPSAEHYYQPAFTLVGAGAYKLDKTHKKQNSLIPRGVEWVRGMAASFDPDNNAVKLDSGEVLNYDYLIVCTGLELNWDKIEGARAALGKNGVCSNYSTRHVEYTWECIKGLMPGTKALFTQAPLPFKCPGAPQKIAYLAADYLRKKNILKRSHVHFLTAGPAMFGVPYFSRELDKVAAGYGINVHFQHNLVAIDGENKRATFKVVGGDNEGETVVMDYDMLHFTPYQSPPDSVKSSPLANDAGYVDVDQHTMQHTKYENVFALGDACSTPNSKTAAAVRKQSPVVVKNLLAQMQHKQLNASYDGYGSCPLTTAYGKVIMAEFIYGGKVTPTLPMDPSKERWINWWIKVTGLPIFYWSYMLKGYEWFFKHNTDFVESEE